MVAPVLDAVDDHRAVGGRTPPLEGAGSRLVFRPARGDDARFLAELAGEAFGTYGDYETVAGMLNAAAGAIPQAGDTFFVGGLELTVVQRDDRRVRMVRARRPKASEPPPPRAPEAKPPG